MKNTMLFALIAATCLTSACGKDSKKEPTSTVFHQDSGKGYCAEVIQEDLAARGFPIPDLFSPGACPHETTLLGSVNVIRHAACPLTTDDGLPMTAVFYSKMLDDDGEILDMSLVTPQFICQSLVE